jgi:hypothetical protein
MGMYLQDPSLATLRQDYAFPLETDFLAGTGSSKFKISDTDDAGYPVYHEPDWGAATDLSFERFEREGLIDNAEFHQVNTFAVLSSTLAIVEEELGGPVTWQGSGPLVVRPHAFEGMNAFYNPDEPSLNFGYFWSLFRRTPVWTCLSHDIISHELGHAILDNVRPLYLYGYDLDVGAFHESFSDLLAMFSALQYPAVVAEIYKETTGNLAHPSLISRAGEEFGIGLAGQSAPYLRSALEGPGYEVTLDPAGPYGQPHLRSTIWTAAIYEIMGELLTQTHPDGFANQDVFAVALAEATRWMRGMLFRTLHYLPPVDVTLPMIARLLVEADSHVFVADDLFRNIARDVFARRNLWDETLDFTPPSIGHELRDAYRASPAHLSRTLLQHADALRIPLGPHIRHRTPLVTTTTRAVDKVQENGEKRVVEITHHYLQFSYELLVEVSGFFAGSDEPATFMLTVPAGGTLVLDAGWHALTLATYPPTVASESGAGMDTLTALTALEQKVKRAMERAAGAAASTAKAGAHGSATHVLHKDDSGRTHLMRATCNLADHYQALRQVGPRRRLYT